MSLVERDAQRARGLIHALILSFLFVLVFR